MAGLHGRRNHSSPGTGRTAPIAQATTRKRGQARLWYAPRALKKYCGKKPNEVPRIHKSRLSLSTGLGSKKTKDKISLHKKSDIRKRLAKGDIAAMVEAADKLDEVAVTARGSRIHGMGLFGTLF